jgi:chemotaxis protein histidine kinase CheA
MIRNTHKGNLEIEFSFGIGNTFTVKLPLTNI